MPTATSGWRSTSTGKSEWNIIRRLHSLLVETRDRVNCNLLTSEMKISFEPMSNALRQELFDELMEQDLQIFAARVVKMVSEHVENRRRQRGISTMMSNVGLGK